MHADAPILPPPRGSRHAAGFARQSAARSDGPPRPTTRNVDQAGRTER